VAEDTKPDVIEDDGQMRSKDLCRRVSHDEQGSNCDARSLIAFDSGGGNLKSLTRSNCQETGWALAIPEKVLMGGHERERGTNQGRYSRLIGEDAVCGEGNVMRV
jgi:hypothetical protein